MLGLLLLTLLPLALFGGFDSGNDDIASDDSLNGDDTLSGGSPGGRDPFVPGGGGGASGGGYDDVQFGTEGNDSLTGGIGKDLLAGQGGDDLLRGGRNDDVLAGFAGNDFLKGEDGDDVVTGGAGNDTVWGLDGEDVLIGNGGNDILTGGNGNDALSDFSGSDTLRGGTGSDILTAIDQTDKISAADLLPTTGPDGLSEAEFRAALFATFGRDDLTDAQASTLFAEVRGGERTDDAPDLLDGGAGNDVLLGDDGDTMTGGSGTDLFSVYTDPARASDNEAVSITDLDPSADKLVISVEDNGLGAVTLAADPGGLGTQVLYRGDVVALINGKTPADLSGFLPQILVEKRIDLG
jgi:Ca2+-binding RTX toxin-like protein